MVRGGMKLCIESIFFYRFRSFVRSFVLTVNEKKLCKKTDVYIKKKIKSVFYFIKKIIFLYFTKIPV
jgi:hypothetical protein